MAPTDNLMDLDQPNKTSDSEHVSNQILTPISQVHSSTSESTNSILAKLLSEMQDMKKDNKVVHAKLDKLSDQHDKATKQFVKRLSETEKSLQSLEERNAELEKTLEFLEHENESLYRSTNFQNLILLGLPEEETETDEKLEKCVVAIVRRITASNIELDTVHRNKRFPFEEGKCRPIRIRFRCHSDRNKAYEGRSFLPENHYLNEDLPFRMRRDLQALRKKRAELFDMKIDHTCNYNKRFIRTAAGVEFYVKDGFIYTDDENQILEDENNDEESGNRTNETGQPPLKKRTAGPSTENIFLGREGLRPRPPHMPTRGRGGGRGRGGRGSGRGGRGK